MSPEARTVIEVVLEALDIPDAATVGHEETRKKILNRRLMYTVVVLRSLVEDREYPLLSLDRELAYLREKLAEHPPVGYVTHEQARERLAQGMDWQQAVALDSASFPPTTAPDPKPETPLAAGPESGGPVGDVSSPAPRHAISLAGEEATPLNPPAQTPVTGVTGSAGESASSSAPRSVEEEAAALVTARPDRPTRTGGAS